LRDASPAACCINTTAPAAAPAQRSVEVPMRFLLPAIFLLSGIAPAQLAGSYPVDPKGSGARNYPSLASVAAALSREGISGPVRFELAADTFTESWSIGPFAGASASNIVTFRGVISGSTLLSTL